MIERIDLRSRFEYRKDSMVHCANGPAVEWKDGRWDWILYDTRHRYYGPQYEGGEWWILGKKVK